MTSLRRDNEKVITQSPLFVIPLTRLLSGLHMFCFFLKKALYLNIQVYELPTLKTK